MGRYDDISDAKLRYEVQRFARILQRMEEENEVLDRTADILTLLGELRRMVFAWEVRRTYRGEGTSESEGGDRESREGDAEAESGPGEESSSERIVREAREQLDDFLGGLEPYPDDGPDPDDEPDPDDAQDPDDDPAPNPE